MTETTQTLRQIRRLRVDAVYGKKKHFNAADRKHGYHVRMGVAAIGVNLILASVVLELFAEAEPDFAKWISALLILSSSGLVALQTFLKLQKTIEGHRSIAARYLAVAKKCSRLIAYVVDGSMSSEHLREGLESLSDTYDQISTDANAFPTNPSDYNKAKEGFDTGEESYTDNELEGA